jgi:hypothetical protein
MNSRGEFREVLREVIRCLRTQLSVPGVSPYDARELQAWFHNITVEDIDAVWEENTHKGDGAGPR